MSIRTHMRTHAYTRARVKLG